MERTEFMKGQQVCLSPAGLSLPDIGIAMAGRQMEQRTGRVVKILPQHHRVAVRWDGDPVATIYHHEMVEGV